jgi:hypothetical protein
MSWQTEEKKSQLRHAITRRPLPAGVNRIETSLLSASAVAKIYGYASAMTGSKYRQKYFELVGKSQRDLRIGDDGRTYWGYLCRMVKIYNPR